LGKELCLKRTETAGKKGNRGRNPYYDPYSPVEGEQESKTTETKRQGKGLETNHKLAKNPSSPLRIREHLTKTHGSRPERTSGDKKQNILELSSKNFYKG